MGRNSISIDDNDSLSDHGTFAISHRAFLAASYESAILALSISHKKIGGFVNWFFSMGSFISIPSIRSNFLLFFSKCIVLKTWLLAHQ